jgi:gamma-glutamyl:cysteine ligase YbdK (ATP-grasp superfamily)
MASTALWSGSFVRLSSPPISVVEQVRADAEALGCVDELSTCSRIAREGTFAEEQPRRFRRDATTPEQGFE